MDDSSQNFFKFEKLCIKLFENLGFNVKYEEYSSIFDKDMLKCDFVLNINDISIVVDTKCYNTNKPNRLNLIHSARQLDIFANNLKTEYKLLIINCEINPLLIAELKNTYNLNILTSANILYLSKDNLELYDNFKSIFNNSLIKIDLNEYQPNIEFLNNNIKKSHTNKTSKKKTLIEENLINELINTPVSLGKKYENICQKILLNLFKENFAKHSTQKRTDDGLNQFDLVCRINKGTNAFWDLIIDEFNSRYIIFEFKNYEHSIKQTQIYTTEKYLFQKALRNVAFIISRKGADDNAIKVTKGILRETGKLIINLSDEDLINMLKNKIDGNIPSDYLFDKVDDFLLSMEK